MDQPLLRMLNKVLLFSAFAWMPMSAHAGLMLKLSDGVNNLTITDEGAGDSATGVQGVISYAGYFGGSTFSVITGSSKPVSGTGIQPVLMLTGFSMNMLAAKNLSITLTDTGFVGPTESYFLSSMSKTDTSGNKYTLNTYLDDSDQAFGMPTTIASGLQVSGVGASSALNDWSVASASTSYYSLTMAVDLKLNAHSTAQFNSLLAIPTPSLLSLFGLAGLGCFGFTRRYQK